MTAEELKERLKEIKYPGFSRDIVSFGVVKDIRFRDDATELHLSIVTQNADVRAQVLASVEKLLDSIDGIPKPEIIVEQGAPDRRAQAREMATAMGGGPGKPAGIKRVVAVASGKGGVGKSTVASNLAVALSKAGHRVGLLDTDIYGPSIPTMFGLAGSKQGQSDEDGRLIPIQRYGVKLVSMGFFVGQGAPLIWRGPMLSKALGQFFNDVNWGELDYLILDLPPGTGDVQMTLTQTIALDGGIIVTTPQDVALADVERGVKMFQQAATPVLGVIENMSFHVCSSCGEQTAVFGAGGGARVAEKYGVAFLGGVPLLRAVREAGDKGRPIAAAGGDSEAAAAFKSLAGRIVIELPVAEVVNV